MEMIPYGRQDVTEADINAVISVLRSDFLTQGPTIPRFERRVAEYVGVRHALAVNSATSALHIACLALGLGKGDRLWTTPITFVASANCGLYCGAQIDFVDIDEESYNICPRALEAKLLKAELNGLLPKVLVVVHFCGQSCDMATIYRLSERFGFKIIEDASHAIGGRYKDLPVGNCRYSDITVFSFHPVKIITTGEGGMVLTNDKALFDKMTILRSHGISRDPTQMTRLIEGPWYYQQIELGFNYRMTDLQAALGLSQMDRLDGYVARRHELVNRYNCKLAGLPLTIPRQFEDSFSSHHLYIVRLNLTKISIDRRAVFERLLEQGIGVNIHYIPVHTQPYYERMGFKLGDYPNAESYYADAITLPLYATLSDAQQDKVIEALQKALN